ncbi:MAG: hypothetical protein EOO11_14775 [Chitinophagaceae bacterium]|nr:MAG: hypothetical protein EOO11_14775 [Chitinophagaceae bacterium]
MDLMAGAFSSLDDREELAVTRPGKSKISVFHRPEKEEVGISDLGFQISDLADAAIRGDERPWGCVTSVTGPIGVKHASAKTTLPINQ